MQRPASGGHGNEILNLVEMLDGESTMVKEVAVKDLLRRKLKIGIYCHDCACRLKARFEGRFCDKCKLDGYHAKKHKCGLPAVVHRRNMNSQAAEQLWSRLDKLSFATEYSRARYRFFWFCYAKWRNSFVRTAGFVSDTTPLASRRRLRRHGR